MNSFVALDVETANDDISSICSIGIAYFNNGSLSNQYYSLVNPHATFSSFNTHIHGISAEDVTDAPNFFYIFSKFVSEIKNIPVVTHTSFDIRAIKKASSTFNINYDPIYFFDSYLISRKIINNPHHRLIDLAKYYNIPNKKHHNAINDAVVCGKSIISMSKENNVTSIHDLCELAGYTELGYLSSNEYHKFSKYKYCESTSQSADYISADKIIELTNDVDSIKNKNIVFTGKLESMTRQEAKKIVAENEVFFQKGVNRTTNLLVVGSENKNVVGEDGKSAKIKKVENLKSEGFDIEIIDESDFLKIIQK